MTIESRHVLILDGYARQSLPMSKGFKELGYEVTVTCFSRLDVAYASRYVDHKELLPCDKEDYARQEELTVQMIKNNHFSLVIPMTDYSAIYLARHKSQLSQYANICVSDPDVFQLAINKTNTMRICVENNIPAPRTLFSDHPLEDVQNSDLQFPLVVKPQTACGSIGFNIVYDLNHLKRVLSQQDGASKPVFVQEYIPQDGPQYGAEVYRDRNGEFSFVLIDEKPRWYPLDGGSPTINISIEHNEMANMARRLLNAMNWHGYANIDFVMDARDHTPKVLEVNARISAAVKLDYCAGIDVAEVIHRDIIQCDPVRYDYHCGIKVSCLLTEILWFIKSKERFRLKPSMFSRKHTTDVIFCWRDPLPFFSFCIQSVMNYRHAMQQRKRY